ncbi:sodium-dependent glucose transporter 1-like isoform X1 [Clavelina lepadiformis]|uniref:Major facilitator superfamily (MFS) profile domain-containing protein n=1 Tax=Clavelina lepadiformis TaxID=159417 RepID=A0ABP0FYT7_CLALP
MWPIYSIALLIAMLILRCATSYYAVIMGPTLLYLAHLVHQEVQDITFTYVALGGGSMLGALVASYVNRNLKQKLNGLFLQAALTLILSGTVVAVPWINQIWQLALIFLVIGINIGYVMVDGQCLVLRTWDPKNARVLMYLLYVMGSLGRFLAPAVAGPFLAMSHENKAETKCSHVNKVASTNVNGTVGTDTGKQFDPAGWSYIIFGIVLFVVGILHIVLGCMKADEKTYEVLSLPDDVVEDKQMEEPLCDVIWILIPLFLYCYCSTGSSLLYQDMIYAVAKCSFLHFSTSEAAWVTAVYSIGLAIGRFSGILFARHVKPIYVVFTIVSGALITMIVMISVAKTWIVITWIVSFFYGFFVGPLVPAAVNWISEVINVSGTYSFIFVLGGAAGTMSLVPSAGALFHLSPFYPVYLMCGVSAFNVICFCLIGIAAKMRKPKKSESEHKLISKEISQDTSDTIQDHPQQEPNGHVHGE